MWTISESGQLSKQVKKVAKKWRHEVSNVFGNLGTVFDALNSGVHLEQLKKLGFVHSEPSGVIAIDQSGPGKGSKMKELRLYVYPDFSEKVIHVRLLADKSHQSLDIQEMRKFVDDLQHRKEDEESQAM